MFSGDSVQRRSSGNGTGTEFSATLNLQSWGERNVVGRGVEGRGYGSAVFHGTFHTDKVYFFIICTVGHGRHEPRVPNVMMELNFKNFISF